MDVTMVTVRRSVLTAIALFSLGLLLFYQDHLQSSIPEAFEEKNLGRKDLGVSPSMPPSVPPSALPPCDTEADLAGLWELPFFENCTLKQEEYARMDTLDVYAQPPAWVRSQSPPWIRGTDDNNLPLTRQVQTDLWLHQHPPDCRNESLRFIFTDWVDSAKLGLGAQMNAMIGVFSLALRENRILVLENFNRADHEECQGPSRAQWSCYFLSETSPECKARARELAKNPRSWRKRIVTRYKSYPHESLWSGNVSERWGKPWESITVSALGDVVNGEILQSHKAVDLQWWRAQALRYLMRFPSAYTCQLLNRARHEAFGSSKAAHQFLQSPSSLADANATRAAWMPRPILSMHVRQGDKALEMKIANFKTYMGLAKSIRSKVPELKRIWLSTEMQNVIDESVEYSDRWEFYYTNIPRQHGNTSMKSYEDSLGRAASSNNAFVNFLMASDCDYFAGALGSTWSYMLDCMRLTGGKMNASFYSVNKDRYW